MITEEVIHDIYKKFRKPTKEEDLNLDYFFDMLREHHHFKEEDDEIIVEDLDEFNPFRRFLKRGLYAVLEFDKWVAFVFGTHILFFSKIDDKMSVNLRPDDGKKNILDKIFGR